LVARSVHIHIARCSGLIACSFTGTSISSVDTKRARRWRRKSTNYMFLVSVNCAA
jgi:hypothetical protein